MTDYKKLGRLGFTGFASFVAAGVLTYFVATASCWKGEEQENKFEIELTDEEKEKQQCLEPTDENLETTLELPLTSEDYNNAGGFEHETVYQGKEFDYEIDFNGIQFGIETSTENGKIYLSCDDNDYNGQIDRIHLMNVDSLAKTIFVADWNNPFPLLDFNNIDRTSATEWRAMAQNELDKFEEREDIPGKVRAYIGENPSAYKLEDFRTD